MVGASGGNVGRSVVDSFVGFVVLGLTVCNRAITTGVGLDLGISTFGAEEGCIINGEVDVEGMLVRAFRGNAGFDIFVALIGARIEGLFSI